MQIYFLIVGLLCAAGGFALLVQRVYFFFTACRATGQVEEVYERDDAELGRQFTAVISFRAINGEIIRFRAQRYRPRIGDHRTVYYAPKNPQKAYVSDILGFWAAPFAMLLLGAGGLLAAL
jgi:hypothetical protein